MNKFLKNLSKNIAVKILQNSIFVFQKKCKCKRLTVFDLHAFLYVYLFALQLHLLDSLEKSQ